MSRATPRAVVASSGGNGGIGGGLATTFVALWRETSVTKRLLMVLLLMLLLLSVLRWSGESGGVNDHRRRSKLKALLGPLDGIRMEQGSRAK